MELNENLVERLLSQNEKLIDSLTQLALKSSPAEVLKAINPQPVYMQPATDHWQTDQVAAQQPEDPWGDPKVPDLAVIPGYGGWTEPPFKEQNEGPTPDTPS